MRFIRSLMLCALASTAGAQTRPQFEVAVIRPSPACGIGNPSGGITRTPERFRMACTTLQELIVAAYVAYADGAAWNPRSVHAEISGLPGWAKADFYTIEAKAEGAVPMFQMLGPMMQTLLEDRFQLKLRRSEKSAPLYLLTLAKGPLKLQRAQTGDCVKREAGQPAPPPARGQSPTIFCGSIGNRFGSPTKLDGHAVTMADLARRLNRGMDRQVIDMTGLEGEFNFHLEFAPSEATPQFGVVDAGRVDNAAADLSGVSVFQALQDQLGLKLESGVGQSDLIIVDHVERPNEN